MMYSLNYSAKDGWTLWVDTNLGPVLIDKGWFRHCWITRELLELRKKGVYKPYDIWAMD